MRRFESPINFLKGDWWWEFMLIFGIGFGCVKGRDSLQA
jgi:hypothetical protein